MPIKNNTFAIKHHTNNHNQLTNIRIVIQSENKSEQRQINCILQWSMFQIKYR